MGFEVYWKADADGSRMRGRYVKQTPSRWRFSTINSILGHFQRKAESKEYVTIQFLDQISGELNSYKNTNYYPRVGHRPTYSRRHEAKEFVRITNEISLTRSTHQFAASKSSGR